MSRRIDPKRSFRFLVRVLAAVCVAAVLLGGPSLGPAGYSLVGGGLARADELEDAQKELDRIQKTIEEKQAEIRQLESQRNTVIRDLNRIERELEGLQAELSTLRRELHACEASIAATEVEIADAEGRLEVRTELMGTRIRAMSEVGYVNYLEVLLGSRSFSDFVARFELLRQILSADVKLFREVKEEKRQLEAKKAYLEEQRANLTQIKTSTVARKAAVEQRQLEKQRLQRRLQNDIEATKEAVEELERLSKELERIIFEIQRARGLPGGKPVFQWPVGSSYPITSRFGMRYHPILKVNKMHTGIDIGAPLGTTVRAAASGWVIVADWTGGYGKCVIIDHGGYWSSLYAHLNRISVGLNTYVSQGDPIGEVGSTGYSTGPHLHFEIRDEGTPVDPLRGDLLPPK